MLSIMASRLLVYIHYETIVVPSTVLTWNSLEYCIGITLESTGIGLTCVNRVKIDPGGLYLQKMKDSCHENVIRLISFYNY